MLIVDISIHHQQNSMLDKISRLGQKRPRPDGANRESDIDLEPLNFKVGSKPFQPACLPATLPESITPVQVNVVIIIVVVIVMVIIVIIIIIIIIIIVIIIIIIIIHVVIGDYY